MKPRRSLSFALPLTVVIAAITLSVGGCASGDSASPQQWHPSADASFDYLIGATSASASRADVVALDWQVDPAEVSALHDRGAKAVCYVNAGAWEPYRPDSDSFPQEMLGLSMEGWPDERWLDISTAHQVLPLVEKRVQPCRDAGFDAVDFDNVDGYANDTGFALTADHQLTFNRALADLAHQHGMAAGLKNDLEQVADLAGAFDFAVNEQCIAFSECSFYAPFAEAGKSVFNIEYEDTPTRCEAAREYGVTSILADLDLNEPGLPCPAPS